MDDELRPEYDLSQLLKNGVRGKYAEQYQAGTNFVFAFHNGEEIGPRMLARIAKHTGLKPDNL